MSQDTEQESKTEKASERRISDALEKGNTPFSTEAVTLGSIIAIMFAISLSGSHAGKILAEYLFLNFDHVGDVWLENGNDFASRLQQVFRTTFVSVLPIWVIVAAGGVIGSLGQNVPSTSLERLQPKWERLSPASNFKRIFGREALVNFGKSIFKLTAVGLVIYHSLKANLLGGTFSVAQNANHLPEVILDVAKSILAPLCLLAFAVAVVDIVVTRLKWNNKLMMTRQEVKDEFKQAEGDPLLKERIKTLGRQRARSRMMADLPKATVVIANPTHYSVALRYVPTEGGAPMVIAKGIDHLALKIRYFCEDKNIPVIENRELARGLYGTCDVGTMIPTEFYRAVAEIIHYIEVRKRLASKRPA